MRYIKTYESHEELRDNLAKLKSQVSTLKTLLKMNIRQKTPSEIYEDFFLEFKESEKFHVRIDRNNHGVGPITINLWNMVDVDMVESELPRYVKKLDSIKERLIESGGFDCHFTIKLNGKVQNVQTGYDRKKDKFEFQGIGDRNHGYDSDGNYRTNDRTFIGSKEFPEGKVSVHIAFLVI